MSLVTSAELVGREAERAELTGALDAARGGRSTVVLVGGEAGVGKSRLVREVTNTAADDGWLVLEGGCLDLGDGALPLAPVVEMLRRLPERLPAERTDHVLGPWRRELASLVPSLAGDDEPVGEVTLLRDGLGRLLEILLSTLRRLAEGGPTLLVFEDLHWADQSTRDLLSFLARNLDEEPVVLLVTFRTDELHRRHPLRPLLADLQRGARPLRVDLDRLGRADLDLLLRGVVGAEVAPDLVDEIWERSEGNPFFAEELVASGGRGRDLPPTVQDVLLARVERVSPEAAGVLGVAAVAGRRVRHDLLADLCQVGDAELSGALDELLAAHLLVAEADGFTFRHALVQEVAYEELLPGDRTRLHLRLAETLADECPTDASRAVHTAELAHHWYAARRLDEALTASVEAARMAEAVGALPEAARQMERALELWEQVDDPEALSGGDHVDLLRRTAQVLLLVGSFSRSRQLLQQALRELDVERDPVRAGLVLERMGQLEWEVDESDPLTTLERAVALVPADPPSAERAFVLAANARMLMLLGRIDQAIVRADEAIAVARAVGARGPEGHARNTRGACSWGRLDEGLADLRAALAIAVELDDPDDIGRAYVNLTEVLLRGARWTEVVATGYEGLDEVRRLGLGRTYGLYLRGNLILALVALGRWEEAREHQHEVDRSRPEGSWSYYTSGELLADMGHIEEARKVLGDAFVPEEGSAVLQGLGEHLTGVAALALWEGRYADVGGLLDEARRRLPDVFLQERCEGLFWRVAWAQAELAVQARAAGRDGEAQAAVAVAEDVASFAQELVARAGADGSVAGPVLSGYLPLVRAEVARARGGLSVEPWRVAVAALDELGVVHPAAYARFRLAEALLAEGGDVERAEAAALLAEAARTAASIGAGPLGAEVAALAARAGVGPAPAPATDREVGGVATVDGATALTPREREVLALVAEGLTNGQIAERLFISTKTASVHVSNILAKLGVASRTEAAGVAIRAGLAEIDESR